MLIVGREEVVSEASSTLGSGVRYEVAGLTWQSAADAVSGPLAKVRAFTDDAVETFVNDLRDSRVVNPDRTVRYGTNDRIHPALLQVACARLVASLPASSNPITARDIHEYGDVDTALATHVGNVIAEVSEDHGMSVKSLRSWLETTFVTEIGTLGKAYEGGATTAGMPNSVAQALEGQHLLIARPQAGARWYELLSDRIIQPLRDAPNVHLPAADPTRFLRMAEHALTIGDLDLAERQATKIVREAPEAPHRLLADAYSLLGNLAFERDRFKEAEDCYRKAMEQFEVVSNTRAVALQLAAAGQMLLAQGQATMAADLLRSATVRLPNDLTIRVAYASALRQAGESRAAKAELTMALNIDGGNIPALSARGELLADLGEAREALRDLNRVPTEGRPQIRAARGLALTIAGDRKDARRELTLAVAEGRDNGPALLYAARAYAIAGDGDAAADLAKQSAIAADPPLLLRIVPSRDD